MTLGQRSGVKDGRLLQVAIHDALHQPANKFVAGFIGSPPMNFFSGRLEGTSPASFSSDSLRFELPSVLSARLAAYQGKSVLLGIRPEGIVLEAQGHDRNPPRDSGSCPGPSLRAGVEVVEHMGNEVIAYLKAGDKTIIARVPPRDAPRPGESLAVGFMPEALHFFDPETEATLV